MEQIAIGTSGLRTSRVGLGTWAIVWPVLERMLRQVNEKLESDSNNSELRKQQEDLTKLVGWLMKDEGRRAMRDALRRPPGKPKKIEAKLP